MISMEHLKVIEAIIENGGFRAASESLFKAQSAISYAVRQVESYYGFDLFQRDGYKPVLTEKGRHFYERACHLLAQARDFDVFAKDLANNLETQLKIGVSALMPLEPILDILNEIRREFPKTHLHLTIEVLSGQKMLEQEDLDLSVLERLEQKERFHYQKLANLEMPVCLSAKHPLNSKEHALVTMNQLLDFPQVILKSTLPSDQQVGVLTETVKWYVTEMSAKRMLILKGLGWGRLPRHFVEQDLQDGTLVEAKMEDANLEATMYLARLKNKPHGPAGKAFWQKVISKFPSDSNSTQGE